MASKFYGKSPNKPIQRIIPINQKIKYGPSMQKIQISQQTKSEAYLKKNKLILARDYGLKIKIIENNEMDRIFNKIQNVI